MCWNTFLVNILDFGYFDIIFFFKYVFKILLKYILPKSCYVIFEVLISSMYIKYNINIFIVLIEDDF